MKITMTVDLPDRRAKAKAQIDAFINAEALKTVHADAVYWRLQPRGSDPVMVREKLRLKLISDIDTARTAEEIVEVLNRMEN